MKCAEDGKAREIWAQEPFEQEQVVVLGSILLPRQVSAFPGLLPWSSQRQRDAGMRAATFGSRHPGNRIGIGLASRRGRVAGLFRISGVFESWAVLGEALPPPAPLSAQDSC